MDAFDAAYLEGISERPPPPRRRARPSRPARPHVLPDEGPPGVDAAPPPFPDGPPVMAMPEEPVALGGLVLTPRQQRKKAWVVLDGPTIAAVQTKKPEGVLAVDTDGVILPGLIDLHGHPEFNVFAAWEPPKRYVNRTRWRDSDEYEAVVRTPYNALTKSGTLPSLKATMARYAEVRALVGGVTAIQGASKTYPKAVEALVRNVDLYVFGAQVARNTIDFDRLDDDAIASIRRGIDDGEIRAHYIHLAEGVRGNKACLTEFENFADSGLLGEATVAIHGSALERDQLGQLADAGASLVWSPQSNLRLYGETTDVKTARELGIAMALGADWLPSGSQSLLEELRVARRVLADQGSPMTAKELVQMVTSSAAEIAGLDEHLGAIAAGRPADLVVVPRLHPDGYESVMRADPSTVELVVIGGDFAYGAPWLIDATVGTGGYENVWAWGRRMLLDTGYTGPNADHATDAEFPDLEALRKRMIARYPHVGPIFA